MGQPGGFAHRPGGSRLVQDTTRRGASDAPGKLARRPAAPTPRLAPAAGRLPRSAERAQKRDLIAFLQRR
jgi:hypothetical protein